MAFSFFVTESLAQIADIPNGLAAKDAIYDSLTVSKTALIFWRYEDESNKEPQFLAAVPVGKFFDWPTDLKGRVVEFWMISLTAKGVPTTRRIFEGVYTRFDPGAAAVGPEDEVVAGETLAVNDLLYLYLDGGITKAKKADATDATKPCQAFAVTAGVADDNIRIFLSGNTMTGLAGRTPGAAQYLDTTPGQMTETPPSGTGNAKQQIGVATATTVVNFNPLTGGTVPGTPPDEGLPPTALGLTDLGPSGGDESIQLDWTNNGGTGDNIIERNLDGAGFETLDTVAFNIDTYTDAAHIATGGLLVVYRVRNANVSGYSNEAGIDGTTGTPPSGLTLLKSLIGECDWNVHLSWTAGTGSGNFTVEIKIGTGGWLPASTSVSGTSFDDEEVGSTSSYSIQYRVKRNSITGYSNEVTTFIPRCVTPPP